MNAPSTAQVTSDGSDARIVVVGIGAQVDAAMELLSRTGIPCTRSMDGHDVQEDDRTVVIISTGEHGGCGLNAALATEQVAIQAIGLVAPENVQHGPARKGRGGKIRRW